MRAYGGCDDSQVISLLDAVMLLLSHAAPLTLVGVGGNGAVGAGAAAGGGGAASTSTSTSTKSKAGSKAGSKALRLSQIMRRTSSGSSGNGGGDDDASPNDEQPTTISADRFERFMKDSYVAHDVPFGDPRASMKHVAITTTVPMSSSEKGDASRWHDVIDAAVREVYNRKNSFRNILTQGQKGTSAYDSACGAGGVKRNTSVHWLATDECWIELHRRVGDDVVAALLTKCAVFTPAATGDDHKGVGVLVQLTGQSIGERWNTMRLDQKRNALAAKTTKRRRRSASNVRKRKDRDDDDNAKQIHAQPSTKRRRAHDHDTPHSRRAVSVPHVMARPKQKKEQKWKKGCGKSHAEPSVAGFGRNANVQRYMRHFSSKPGFPSAHVLNRFPATPHGGSCLLDHIVQLHASQANHTSRTGTSVALVALNKSQKARLRRSYRGLPAMLCTLLRNHAKLKLENAYGKLLTHHCPSMAKDAIECSPSQETSTLALTPTPNQGGTQDHSHAFSPTPSMSVPTVTPTPHWAGVGVTTERREALRDEIRKLLASTTSHASVTAFVDSVLRRLLPREILGTSYNFRILRGTIRRAVALRRFESLPLHSCLKKLKLSHIAWLRYIAPRGAKPRDTTPAFKAAQHRRISAVLHWIMADLVSRLLYGHFYMTETQATSHRLLFYRKPVWARLQALFSEAIRRYGGAPDIEDVFPNDVPSDEAVAAYGKASAMAIEAASQAKELTPVASLASAETTPTVRSRSTHVNTPTTSNKSSAKKKLFANLPLDKSARRARHPRMYLRIPANRAMSMLSDGQSVGTAKIRLLPKRGTLRIISNLRSCSRAAFRCTDPKGKHNSLHLRKSNALRRKAGDNKQKQNENWIYANWNKKSVNFKLRDLHAVLQYEAFERHADRPGRHPLLGATVLTRRATHRKVAAYLAQMRNGVDAAANATKVGAADAVPSLSTHQVDGSDQTRETSDGEDDIMITPLYPPAPTATTPDMDPSPVPKSEAGTKSFIISVDFKNAFDSIPHETLVQHVIENPSVIASSEYCCVNYKRVESLADNLRVSSRTGSVPSDVALGHPADVDMESTRRAGLGFGHIIHSVGSAVDAHHREDGILEDDRLHRRALRRRSVYIDDGKPKEVTRQNLIKLLKRHVTGNLLCLGKRWFLQSRGIPQGSSISTLLCCLYYGHMENEILPDGMEMQHDEQVADVVTPTAGASTSDSVKPTSLMLRMVDDTLFMSVSRAEAEAHLKLLSNGSLKETWNCTINHAKTKLNFDFESLPRNEVVDGRGFCFVPWCGLLFRSDTLEVQADYSRWARNLDSSLTVNYAKPGFGLVRRLKQYIEPRMLHILFDPHVNSAETLRLNTFQLYLYCALKVLAYTDWLGSAHTAAFLFRVLVPFMSSMVLRTIRIRYGVDLSYVENQYLCLKAVRRVVVLRQARRRLARKKADHLATLLRHIDRTMQAKSFAKFKSQKEKTRLSDITSGRRSTFVYDM